jgi:hypothetical protein
MQFKKGTSIRDAAGNNYILTGLDIRNQIVKHTVSLPDQEPVPGEMTVSRWKELAAEQTQLEATSIVNKAPEPGKGTDTAVAVAPNKTKVIIKGMLFQMMDKSRWKIEEYNRITKKLVAVNEKTKKPQDFTLDELTTLVNDGHIKILS